jgi:integrase
VKIVDRVRYGERGQGCLVRYEGVATWFSVYHQRGVEHRRTTGKTDIKAARKKHREFLDKVAAERYGGKTLPTPKDERVTVGALLDELSADFRLRGTKWWESGAKSYITTVREWFDEVRATKLMPLDVDRYIEAKLREGYAPASVNRQTGLLRQALRLGYERGKLDRVIKVRRLPERNARQGFFERADVDKVIGFLPDYLQDFTRFAYLTAWRRGEVSSLRWSDVDRNGGVIRLRPDHSKNGRGRTIAIEGDLCRIIERRVQARVVPGKDGQPDRVAEHVFHHVGRAIGDFRKAWASACVEAGLTRLKLDAQGQPIVDEEGQPKLVPAKLFHDLRRSGVRNMVRAGVRERVAMEISGHRTRSIFDRYNITSEEDLRDAMRRTSRYVNAQPRQTKVTAPPSRR